MSAIGDIQTALEARAGTITDALDRAECLALVAEYVALRTAILALSSSKVTTYSLAGRSVTHADLPTMRREANSIRAQIDTHLHEDRILVADLESTGIT